MQNFMFISKLVQFVFFFWFVPLSSPMTLEALNLFICLIYYNQSKQFNIISRPSADIYNLQILAVHSSLSLVICYIMGILPNRSINRIPIRIEESVENDGFADDFANYVFDSDFSDSDLDDVEVINEAQQVQTKQYGHRRKKAKSFRPMIELVDGLPVKRNMGAQKWRRVENTKLVTSSADIEDICFDGSDLIPETISSFTRLLRDEAKMKVWNEFLEQDEKEQKKMIMQLEYEIIMERNASKAGQSKSVKFSKSDALRKGPVGLSSAECCFQRLDKKFRECLLKRRNVQFDYLYKMEFILRQFFGESPADIYAEEIISQIKRFHLHAVAQFLQLNSITMDGENCAIVQIKNEAEKFSPPDMYLAKLLKKKRKKNTKDDEWNDDKGSI